MSSIFRKIGGYIFNTIMILFSLSCIFPIIWIIYSSLKTKSEFMLNIVSLPAHPQFKNYYTAFFEGKLYTYFISSSF